MTLNHLIRWQQIKDGLQLKDDVESLKESYDALKVLTNIPKGEVLDNYNVNELLIVLKATVDSIVGDGNNGSLAEIRRQIIAITNLLDQRITEIETNGCKVASQYISTVIRENGEATDSKVSSEKAVAAAIHTESVNIKHEINTEISNVNERLDALEGITDHVERIAIVGADVQTEFTLRHVPNALAVVLYINGVEYEEDDAFTVDRAAKKVTWTATKAECGFDITARLATFVKIKYKTGQPVELDRNGVKVIYAAEPPTEGSYNQGDTVYNILPVLGGVEGWTCTAAGTPGSWASFGMIDLEHQMCIEEVK